MMGLAREEFSTNFGLQAIDFISAVSELHRLSSLELSKLITNSNDNVLRTFTKNGSSVEIDVEKLVRYLPLHLLAKVILSKNRDEELLKYLLRGFRLLHSLCDLAPRHPKIEQILLDDVKVSEQLLDLIFYLLAFLATITQGNKGLSHLPLLHSALVASCLHLLTGCISSHWPDVVNVLFSLRKVDLYIDVAFAALCVDIKVLQLKLSGQSTDFHMPGSTAEGALHLMCQQCEGSLQILQLLCQQKLFRERFIKYKELCVKGSLLLLAKAVLSLDISPTYGDSSAVIASVSRLKSRILSILMHLCETEHYLDDIANTVQSMKLAKFVASKVILLIRNINEDPKKLSSLLDNNYPTGLLQLNALRLADVLSDDSNFRSYTSVHFAELLTTIFSHPHREFLSSWCSSELPLWEVDANLEYDSFVMAGCILDSVSSSDPVHIMNCRPSLVTVNMPRASYAHQRTSLLVKVIANLHCFLPEICKEKEDVFLNNFIQCFKEAVPKLPASDAEKAAIVKTNLCSLLNHAESLTPHFLCGEDVQLLRVFVMRCKSLIASAEHETNQHQENNFEVPFFGEKLSQLSFSEHLQEAQSLKGSSPHPTNKTLTGHTNGTGNSKEGTSDNSASQAENRFDVKTDNLNRAGDRSGNVKGDEIMTEIHNVESSGSDSSSSRGNPSINPKHNVDNPNISEQMKECGFSEIKEAAKSETVQHEETPRRKRKRKLMNAKQVSLIEMALSKEPDMQRNSASLLSWAEHLSTHGFEVTTNQLKNWLNNRKARLAKAAKDSRVPSEGETILTEKYSGTGGIGSHYDSSGSPAEVMYTSSSARGERTPRNDLIRKEVTLPEYIGITSAGFVQCKPGRHVVLIGRQGEEIGRAKVFQVQGEWLGYNLQESEMCVVDITELNIEEMNRLPYPCEATCTTFYETRKKFGIIRILWDSNKMFMLPPQ